MQNKIFQPRFSLLLVSRRVLFVGFFFLLLSPFPWALMRFFKFSSFAALRNVFPRLNPEDFTGFP